MCAGLSPLSAVLMVRYGESDRWRDAIVGVVLTGLAVLRRPLALGVLPALVLFAMYPGRDKRSLRRSAIVLAGIVLVPYFAWDRWTNHLVASEMNGVSFISLEHEPRQMLANVRNATYGREATCTFSRTTPDPGSSYLRSSPAPSSPRARGRPRALRLAITHRPLCLSWRTDLRVNDCDE